jgi:hypothetical protein
MGWIIYTERVQLALNNKNFLSFRNAVCRIEVFHFFQSILYLSHPTPLSVADPFLNIKNDFQCVFEYFVKWRAIEFSWKLKWRFPWDDQIPGFLACLVLVPKIVKSCLRNRATAVKHTSNVTLILVTVSHAESTVFQLSQIFFTLSSLRSFVGFLSLSTQITVSVRKFDDNLFLSTFLLTSLPLNIYSWNSVFNTLQGTDLLHVFGILHGIKIY